MIALITEAQITIAQAVVTGLFMAMAAYYAWRCHQAECRCIELLKKDADRPVNYDAADIIVSMNDTIEGLLTLLEKAEYS